MSLLDRTKLHNGTARATVKTETVWIPSECLAPLLDEYPAVRERLEALEMERLIENVQRTFEDRSTGILDFLRTVGAGEATNMLLIDESLCVRCDNCERACEETHGGVSRLDRAAGPTFASIHIPTSCRHCENAKCMTDCPPDALVRLSTGEIHIKEDICIGCENCAKNCPYHVIQMAPRTPARRSLLDRLAFWNGKKESEAGHAKVAVKCDLCRDLPGIKKGTGQTACVAACPTGAIVRVDPVALAKAVLEPQP
jgi:Fe-S-cluster-containing dehydrogenase component